VISALYVNRTASVAGGVQGGAVLVDLPLLQKFSGARLTDPCIDRRP
jgi:hypothetical protein